MNYKKYLKYAGIFIIILGALPLIGAFLPFAVGNFNVLFWGLRVEYIPFFNDLNVEYWSEAYLLYDDPDKVINYFITKPLLDIFYNNVFNGFVPSFTNVFPVIIIIIAIATVIAGIIEVIKHLNLYFSALNMVMGVFLIIFATLPNILFKNQIFQRIYDFEIVYDVPVDALIFVTTDIEPRGGVILIFFAAIMIEILSFIALIYSYRQRKKDIHIEMEEKASEPFPDKTISVDQPEQKVPTEKQHELKPNYCSNCGQKVEDDFQKFCPYCGAKL